MNTRRFVSGLSLILVGWLGATFLNEVPPQRYPRLNQKSASAGLSAHVATVPVSASR